MGLAEKHAVLDALMTAVDEETALEIIDYRKRMGRRYELTPRAAGMLAGNLAACPNPIAAADEMMLRGWTAVKPEWIARTNGTQRPGIAGAAQRMIEARHVDTRADRSPDISLFQRLPAIARH